MNHTSKLIIIAMALMMSILLSGCGGADDPAKLKETIVSNCDYEINDFILDKISHNRIVMIGDSGHGQYLYMKTVSNLLDHWITTIENEGTSNVPTKICLVLEMDSSYACCLNQFIQSGMRGDLLDFRVFSSTDCSTADFLFYNDLRKIMQKVNEFNRTTFQGDVHLEIIGAEQNWDIANWIYKDEVEYFIYQRDKDIKGNIKAYIDTHPDYNVLVYYGSAHMAVHKAPKSIGNVSGETYNLGHYLQVEYGNNGGFYRICQANPVATHSPMDAILREPDEDYIIDNKYFKNSKDFLRIAHSDGDVSVIHISKAYSLKPINTVQSENIAGYLVENLDTLKNLSHDFQRLVWGNVFNYLYIISGKELPEPVEWKNKNILDAEILKWKDWYENSDHDNVAEIESLSIWNRLIDNLEKSPPERIRRSEALLAIALDMEALNQTGMSAEERAEGYRRYINETRKNIVIDNLIPLLIIGTDREREQALVALKKETGKDFDDYSDWVEWRYRVRSLK